MNIFGELRRICGVTTYQDQGPGRVRGFRPLIPAGVPETPEGWRELFEIVEPRPFETLEPAQMFVLAENELRGLAASASGLAIGPDQLYLCRKEEPPLVIIPTVIAKAGVIPFPAKVPLVGRKVLLLQRQALPPEAKPAADYLAEVENRLRAAGLV